MASQQVDKAWMWHPDFTEERTDTAGRFVHFRRILTIEELPSHPLRLRVSADTRYKLFVNRKFVAMGPVKGDQKLWFFDEVNIAPFLETGENIVAVHVLRFFHATPYAASFPRLPVGGLMINPVDCGAFWASLLQSSNSWESAIDMSVILSIDQPEDDFLHVYEVHNVNSTPCLTWTPAKVYEFQSSTGLGAPWKLSPRMIPLLRFESSRFTGLHNVKSRIPESSWEKTLLHDPRGPDPVFGLLLPAHTSHSVELEVSNHSTALLNFSFRRPASGGASMKVTYAESYEDLPPLVPYQRSKKNRRDSTKLLYGPHDYYMFRGSNEGSTSGYNRNEATHETSAPFHFRTFRFIRLEITVGSAELVLDSITIIPVTYPLDVSARFDVGDSEGHEVIEKLWTTSIRTLSNCMHDCYEDCPFYEQLQYAMDMRSSALFTYYVSGDDRLARQGLTQIHNSYEPRLGLTNSRAPCHQSQIIPHFSLYWICALYDHYAFFGDKFFIRPFIAVIDGVLEYFNSRIDPTFSLVAAKYEEGKWNFTDWTNEWRPYGVPPAAERTGFSSYTNSLYAYSLQNAATILEAIGRPSVAAEYRDRASIIVAAIQRHCFDGALFTDGLASAADPDADYSVHAQVFAILCGAAFGDAARSILQKSLGLTSSESSSVTSVASPTTFESSRISKFTQPSLSMSFYTLRALALSQSLYIACFDAFLEPWRAQLALNLTTWEEDVVSQRSDCHAWGSAPIFEFAAEVAGVYPASPGWTVIGFRPKLQLFNQLNCSIPIMVGAKKCLVTAGWQTRSNGDMIVRLELKHHGGPEIPVAIQLPGQRFEISCGSQPLEFEVKASNLVI